MSENDTALMQKTDPRFSLTSWERENVVRLKKACEQEGIRYKSIFELAKYVLVTKSTAKDNDKKADKKRLDAALQRLRKLRAMEKAMQLDNIDPADAMEQIEKHAPGFYLSHYRHDRDGRRVVAHCYEYSPSDFVCSSDANCAVFLAAELHRLELAAADMEEARRGVAVVTCADQSMDMKKAIRYGRMVLKVKEYLSDMHASRIREIYSQVPSILSHLINPAKKIFPKKIAERIKIVSKRSELEKYLQVQPVSLREWVVERQAVYRETVDNLQL